MVNQQMLRVMLNVTQKYFQLGWQNCQLGWSSRKMDQKQMDVRLKNLI